MLRKLFAVVTVLLAMGVNVDAGGQGTLEVVPSIDLPRYMGKWYEIARLPNWFQNSCAGEVTADYSLLEGNQLRVINHCRKDGGQQSKAEGRARLADQKGPNSKLKVRFAPAWLSWLSSVWGDYWVMDLAPDYSYSLVGTPDRKYLWILSRTPQMEAATFEQLKRRAADSGFDVSRLVKTRQGI